jgi:hypothetical protein
MERGMKFTFVVFLCAALFTIVASSTNSEENSDHPKLRNEDEVNKLREEAISKLEVPLEKMKVKVSCFRKPHKKYLLD